jgi:hypothetical protein
MAPSAHGAPDLAPARDNNTNRRNTMKVIPVDTNSLTFIHLGVIEPAVERQGGAPRTNDKGVPLWRIPFVVLAPGEKKPEGIVVVVPHATEPKLEQGSEVKLRGLRARFWSMNGSTGTSLSADAFEAPRRAS